MIAVLKSLQNLLVREISRAERKIRRTKAILKELNATPDKAALAEERLEEYRHLRYSWRCFGDAIAFIFIDKYALKQTYFNTRSQTPKQDAGFIGEKSGLKQEVLHLDMLLDHGIPALLSDLTNTIRHGDLCIMAGPDPVLIEVKSGKLDARGRRQRGEIQQLMSFFNTDEAKGLRGFDKLVRVAHETPEVNYVDEINLCAHEASKSGSAWNSPEDGLFYVAIAGDNAEIESVLGSLPLSKPTIFPLNEVKATREWTPYSPFTLSIREPDALFRFIWGEIYLLVIYETDTLRRLAESKGIALTFLEEESEYAFEISRPPNGAVMRASKQLFARVGMDFSSPSWLLQMSIDKLEYIQEK